MGLLRLKVNGEYVTVAQGPAGPIGPQGPQGPEIAVLTTAQRDALVAPDLFEGKVIYNSDTDTYQGYVGGSWGDFITSAGGTMAGRLTLKTYRETTYLVPTTSGTITLDTINGTIQRIQPSDAITIANPTMENGDSILLRINGWSGLSSVVWPGEFYWSSTDGLPPALETNKHHWFILFKEAGAIWASYLGAFV